MALNRTGIETADFTWNLYTGCLRGCPFCYARNLARGRLKKLYLTNPFISTIIPEGADPGDTFFPRFWPHRIRDPLGVSRKFQSKNPHLPQGTAMIFAIDMGDIFGSSIPDSWVEVLMNAIKGCPHIFQILTKFPENLLQYTKGHDFPANVWAGVTVCNQSMVKPALDCLSEIDASVKYLCVEPLQEKIVIDLSGVNWIIVGAQTNPLVLPKQEWVELLLREAQDCGTRIFLKKSLQWDETVNQWASEEIKLFRNRSLSFIDFG